VRPATGRDTGFPLDAVLEKGGGLLLDGVSAVAKLALDEGENRLRVSNLPKEIQFSLDGVSRAILTQ
jgi:hypothetical protein